MWFAQPVDFYSNEINSQDFLTAPRNDSVDHTMDDSFTEEIGSFSGNSDDHLQGITRFQSRNSLSPRKSNIIQADSENNIFPSKVRAGSI